ncbi:uncharacterized protein LOC142318888 isoform X2 [Lycorma delicatula]|uniref:uncharacterized protein LOC142318888 isoform X2 n=1 Tax=Lycorma delicatula TaxID=130591 RepID=UPI003F514B9B
MGHLSTTTTCGIILSLFSTGLLFSAGETVRIKSLRVPEVVQNGSESSVILDCDYTLDSQDGLVVKWFFNNNPSPVYQWIPDKKPQDLGVLKGKLNLDYRASDEENKKHRALQIIRPTTELSGEYKCLVSTFDGEASEARKMIIYVPERSLELKELKPKEDEDKQVTVKCEAEGVYPKPNMTIFADNPAVRQKVESVIGEPKETPDGLYDISAKLTIEDGEFNSPTLFICELRIPEANYNASREYRYLPENVSGSSRVHYQWVFTALSFAFFFLSL